MPEEKKRKRSSDDASEPTKKTTSVAQTPVRRDLLERCFPIVTTLRDHLLSKLPSGSRLRRKKIATVGKSLEPNDIETRLAQLLDSSLVCAHEIESACEDTRWAQWLSFSQKGDESYIPISKGIEGSIFSQSEIVDFVIWLLFSRDNHVGRRTKHLLCDGFRRSNGPDRQNGPKIPGLTSLYPNSHVQALKDAPWPQLLALLGQSGEKIMINLLLDYSIFVPIPAGFCNYHQINGLPLSELDLPGTVLSFGRTIPEEGRKTSDITLVKSRIFYAKPSLTAKGEVLVGFKHIHVLNRCRRRQPLSNTKLDEKEEELRLLEQRRRALKIMMYIFPRQFGLHNVFTSKVNPMETAQKFKDYTLREDEIRHFFQTPDQVQKTYLPKIPKRLRGNLEHLVQRLQTLHARCSYFALLRHYCPCVFDEANRVRSAKPKTTSRATQGYGKKMSSRAKARQSAERQNQRSQAASQLIHLPRHTSLVEFATSPSQVSAFCQAVLSKVIPDQFWGEGETQFLNKAEVLRKIDHFIRLRRFENMSLHEVAQNLKLNDIGWLQPPDLQGKKPSKTDTAKRREIFLEFLYYVFDSLLIPLIRSNFYVTESNTYRYQVFYFRHEVWKYVAEPAMATLKEDMFEEVKLDQATRILQSRRLGYSQIRLLPKGEKLRPITNLRRRTVLKAGSKILGPSINSILGPVHSLLKLEKALNPSKLGSTLFSVSDIYDRLKTFKESLGSDARSFYFAKVDVKAAFDTIPQDAVVKLMASVPSQDKYRIAKHAEVKPGERPMLEGPKSASKAIRRWHATALAEGDAQFSKRLEDDLATNKKNTIFIESAVQKTHGVQELLALLGEHVEQNLVKIGKKFFRQKKGIPQGSVLSSFLCNYFYADLEAQQLGFLSSPDCLLLRLIDDFLLITLDKSKAEKFVTKMQLGVPDYGVEVNPAKTLVNFNMNFGGAPVPKFKEGAAGFPYCGTRIDCRTLDIKKDRQRGADLDIATSLTVDFGRAPGQNFQRKVLNAFKIQSHLMFFDTSHNSTQTVHDSLHGAFCETASKMWAYIRCFPKPKQPSSGLIIRTIIKVADVAFMLLTGKSRRMRFPKYACTVKKAQVSLIACRAFGKVLRRKQANFRQVMNWLEAEAERLAPRKKNREQGLTQSDSMVF